MASMASRSQAQANQGFQLATPYGI